MTESDRGHRQDTDTKYPNKGNIQLFEKLARRQVVGTYNIAMETLLVLRNVVSQGRWSTIQQLISIIRQIGLNLEQAEPTELAVGNMVRRVLHTIREEFHALNGDNSDIISESFRDSTNSPNLKAVLVQTIMDLKDELESTRINIVNQAHEHIYTNEIILTIGHSSTIIAFIKEAAKYKKFQVLVAESSPSFSGHHTAKILSQLGIETTLILDASIFAVMSKVTKVILSAHVVKPNGSMISIIGSQVIITAAKMHSCPVIVLCGVYKISPVYFSREQMDNYGNPMDIDTDEDAKNPIFDYCDDERLFFCTNNGGWDKNDIHRLVDESYCKEDNVLGELN